MGYKKSLFLKLVQATIFDSDYIRPAVRITFKVGVMMKEKGEKTRCFGSGAGKEFYAKYHDEEWGRPVHDDRHLFEMLILEGAQAGLSWETILKRRNAYRQVFKEFEPEKVATMSDQELEEALLDERIIRNRLKVYSVRKNALEFLKIQKEFGSFDAYLWSFVGGKPIVTRRCHLHDVPAVTPESKRLSQDLKKRGMNFVGPTIIYAYMQAIGMVDDHLEGCWLVNRENGLL